MFAASCKYCCVQPIDRLTQFRDGSGVQKHIVRGCQARGAARLRGEDRAGLLLELPSRALQPLYLQRFVRIDNQHAIHALPRGPALDQQGYGHDHDKGPALAPARVPSRRGSGDEGWHPGLRAGRIVEYQVSQRPPVELAVREDARAKALYDLCKSRLCRAPRLRDATSASITGTPSSAKRCVTVLLPLAMPPVRPIRSASRHGLMFEGPKCADNR